MHYVSLIVEFLRGRPAAVFWTAALAQAALWTLVPSLIYSAPPGGVPMLLAIGHEFMLGSYLGPPLAFWLGEIAYRIGGAFGVYVLAQACIVVTYWAVFTLGRAIVGTRHAVLAVLLMVGIATFTVSSVEFGPTVLAAPFWALALLHYWRAIGEDRRGYWFLLAIDLGLLLLSNYIGLILLLLIVLFTLSNKQGLLALRHPEPWVAMLLTMIVLFPHAVWLYQNYPLVHAGLADNIAIAGRLTPALWLAAMLVAVHLGLLLLIVLATGWPKPRRVRAPAIDRNPVGPFAHQFVLVFAVAPAAVAVVLAFAIGRLGPLASLAPLVTLSGLAVIVAARDQVLLYRERLVSTAWLSLLVIPPALVVAGITVLPWIAEVDPQVALPAKAEGRFFGDTFARRTGKPLAYVTGDDRLALLVALGAPSRPHVFFAWAPERSPWATAADVRRHGGVLVWPANGKKASPPDDLKAQFPEMVPEVPRTFTREVQGFLPTIRLGWSVLRPKGP
jgi:4-amino-4-deoxy-L-arabinose transferase-like glycosyltransferase